ncbi:hypothetical protein TYRP_021278 [Tyrophagus putrescentiae]|nr:hypothetical protein TYRP_021278 [Tyrophagus putrescentiae]
MSLTSITTVHPITCSITPPTTPTTDKTMSFTPAITSLPDLVLVKVFSKLPLLDLLRLNSVCRRFAELQSAALLKKTSLAVADLKMATFYLDSLDFYRISEHSTFDLVVEYEFTTPLATPTKLDLKRSDPERLNSTKPKSIVFNARTCNALIERLPNIRRLTLANYSKSLLIDAHTVEMLKAWAPRLTHLTLHGFNNWEVIEPYINLLTKLEYLSSWVSLTRLAKLTISKQLTEFYVKYSKTWDQEEGDWEAADLEQTLQKLPPFYLFGQTPQTPPPTPVVQKLTRLSIKLNSLEQLDAIVGTFRYLKYLHLEYFQLDSTSQKTVLEAILSRLSGLQFLTTLSLDIINRFNYSGSVIADISNDELSEESNSNYSSTSVLWVKEVKFHFPLNPHTLQTIEKRFPNVQSATFRVLSCTELKKDGLLLCSDDQCTGCGHLEAVVEQYREMVQRKVINSFIVDFAFKYGKIIAHSVSEAAEGGRANRNSSSMTQT